MATQATNPQPLSILEAVAPRVPQSAKHASANDSGLPSLGLGSIGKATGALGAPVAGLVAVVAIGAASAGVGAGLGSLPGTHGLAGAGGHPPVPAIGEARPPGAPLETQHGALAGRNPLRMPAAVALLAGPLTDRALAGVGVGPRHGDATTPGAVLHSGGVSIQPGSTRGVRRQPVSSVGPGGTVVVRSGTRPTQNGHYQSPSGSGGGSSQPSGGSQIPSDNPGQSGHGLTGSVQGGSSQSLSSSSGWGQSSSSQTGSGGSSSQPTTSSGGSGSAGSSGGSSTTSSSQPATTSGNSPQTTTATPNQPAPATHGGESTTSTTTGTTSPAATQSDSKDHFPWRPKRHP